MALHTFSPNTVISSTDVMADLSGLADGSNDATANSLRTYRNESDFPWVASGLVWTGDSYGVNKNASMTAGVVYINGRRISISAVTARVFTASKDTYVDILDNADGTGTIVYTETTNNAASVALASNSIRIAIIVTGATTIAAAGSINQGAPTAILPIASSIAYSICDSLGNMICNRAAVPEVIGLRQLGSDQGSITGLVDITGLNLTVLVPTGRKIKVCWMIYMANNTGTTYTEVQIQEDGSNIVTTATIPSVIANAVGIGRGDQVRYPASGSHSYKARAVTNSGTATAKGSSTQPSAIWVELA